MVKNSLNVHLKELGLIEHDSIEIPKITIGMTVGKCKNCGAPIELRQPWASEMPEVNDDWYLLHCTNEKCHNRFGWELSEEEFCTADFVIWDDLYIPEADRKMPVDTVKIIQFPGNKFKSSKRPILEGAEYDISRDENM